MQVMRNNDYDNISRPAMRSNDYDNLSRPVMRNNDYYDNDYGTPYRNRNFVND